MRTMWEVVSAHFAASKHPFHDRSGFEKWSYVHFANNFPYRSHFAPVAIHRTLVVVVDGDGVRILRTVTCVVHTRYCLGLDQILILWSLRIQFNILRIQEVNFVVPWFHAHTNPRNSIRFAFPSELDRSTCQQNHISYRTTMGATSQVEANTRPLQLSSLRITLSSGLKVR